MIIMTGHVICHLVVTFDKNRWVWGRLFCSKDGRLEVIVDSGKDGVLKPNEIKISNIVTDPTNAGTYNYYAPNKL